VPRGAVPAYRRALARAAGDAGLTIVVSGPWAPYAFADIHAS
jgi:Gas vesicle synthesis protein GvpL/GvpF